MDYKTLVISALFVIVFTKYMIQAWFESTLAVQILNLIHLNKKKFYTRQEVEEYLLDKPKFIYDLLTCPTCMSLHLSLWAMLFSLVINKVGGSYFLDSVFIVFLGALLGSMYNKNTTSESNKVSALPQLKNAKVIKTEYTKTTPPKQKSAKDVTVEDFGGFLLRTDETGKREVVGTTKMYSDYVVRVFDETMDCNFPRCKEWRTKFKEEIETLELKYAEDEQKCPECIKSGVKRKFYDIIKEELESLKKNARTGKSS